jgi:hypothetical protein
VPKSFGACGSSSRAKANKSKVPVSARNELWSLRVLDYIADLDMDVCGKYIWQHVPSSQIALILGMRSHTQGGFSRNIDFRKWMLSCLQHNAEASDCFPALRIESPPIQKTVYAHIVDINDVFKTIFNPYTKDAHLELVRCKEKDQNFFFQCVHECVEAGLSFWVCVSQCSTCSEIQGVQSVRVGKDCTRTLPTCALVAKCFADALCGINGGVSGSVSGGVSGSNDNHLAHKIHIFKMVVHHINVDSKDGKEVLQSVQRILQMSSYVHGIDFSNIYAFVGYDKAIKDVLSCAKTVECVSIRNIRMVNPLISTALQGAASSVGGHSTLDARQYVTSLGSQCMSCSWMETLVEASQYSTIRSLTISQNVLFPTELMNFSHLLWR